MSLFVWTRVRIPPTPLFINFYNITKKKFFLYSILSGLLLSLGWPTRGNAIFLFIAFVPLLYSEKKFNKSISYVFLFSFITFFIWNLCTTYWLHYSKRIDGTYAFEEAYLIPSIFNSFLMSIVFTFYSFTKKYIKNEIIRYVILICSWIIFEKMHLEWDLSWPWLTLGNGFSGKIKWIQWYEYTGTLGGTIWIWVTNIAIADSIIRYNNIFNLFKKISIIIIFVMGIIIFSKIIYYSYSYEHKYYKNKPIEILILQPNIDPYNQKYKLSTKDTINKLFKLIKKKISKNTMFIIAPETYLPGNGDRILIKDLIKSKIVNNIKNLLSSTSPKAVFITGMELYKEYHPHTKNSNKHNYILDKQNSKFKRCFNSAVKIEVYSKNIKFCNKSKLVPGVEMFPYKKILYPILSKIINIRDNIMYLTKGNVCVLKHNYLNINVAAIICYESIFGEYVTKFFRKNSKLIIIITNDGWWGNSQGHKQHMYYSRLRAIENRKYIARSANTGISCFINDKGDILSSLPYGKEGCLLKKIFFNNKKTFYTKHGDVLFVVSYLTLILIFIKTIYNKFFFNKK